jgi:hypothetical protein
MEEGFPNEWVQESCRKREVASAWSPPFIKEGLGVVRVTFTVYSE